MRRFDIWLRGDVPRGMGHGGVAELIEHQLLGTEEAETFEEAVEKLRVEFQERATIDKMDYFKGLTFWGYPLQPEAPK